MLGHVFYIKDLASLSLKKSKDILKCYDQFSSYFTIGYDGLPGHRPLYLSRNRGTLTLWPSLITMCKCPPQGGEGPYRRWGVEYPPGMFASHLTLPDCLNDAFIVQARFLV